MMMLFLHLQSQALPCRGRQDQPVQASPRPSELRTGASGQPAALPRGGHLQPGQAVHPEAQRQLPAHQELLLRWGNRARTRAGQCADVWIGGWRLDGEMRQRWSRFGGGIVRLLEPKKRCPGWWQQLWELLEAEFQKWTVSHPGYTTCLISSARC